MKILLIGAGDFFSTYGGGQVYVKNLAHELIRQHQQVTILSTLPGIPADTWQSHPYNTNPESTLLTATSLSDQALTALISEITPDIIHAHANKAQAARVARSLGIPVVVTAHHGGIVCPAGALLDADHHICRRVPNHRDCLRCVLQGIPPQGFWHPILRHLPRKSYLRLGSWLSRKPFILFITPLGQAARSIQGKIEYFAEVARNCSAMVAPCNEIAEEMLRCGLPEQKLRIIPHGIPLPSEVPPFPPVKEGAVHFFYVGRICLAKGIHVLLDAWSRLDAPQARLHLIGGAGNKKEARYMASLKKKSKADPRIIWHGKVPPQEVFQTIKDFHMLVSPPIYEEIFGLNISEALAMGKPVIATRSGGPEMQITDGLNGRLVPPNDPEALLAALQEFTTERTQPQPHTPLKWEHQSQPDSAVRSHCARRSAPGEHNSRPAPLPTSLAALSAAAPAAVIPLPTHARTLLALYSSLQKP